MANQLSLMTHQHDLLKEIGDSNRVSANKCHYRGEIWRGITRQRLKKDIADSTIESAGWT